MATSSKKRDLSTSPTNEAANSMTDDTNQPKPGKRLCGDITADPCAVPELSSDAVARVDISLPMWVANFMDIDAGQLGCAAVENVRVRPLIEVQLQQEWYSLGLELGDTAEIVGLAPGESVRLKIRQFERSLLKDEFVDDTESASSSEREATEKDAIRVNNTSAKTDSWRVNTQAGYSLGGFEVSVGAELSSTVEHKTSTEIEKISDRTEKSAESVKLQRKLTVTREDEQRSESEQERRFANPYRDRCLQIHLHEVLKRYCVATRVQRFRPMLALEVGGVHFDWDFVVGQNHFLRGALWDSALAADLDDAFRQLEGSATTEFGANMENHARLALHYLFEVPVVFGPFGSTTPLAPPLDLEASLEAIGSGSGFIDAKDNNATDIFSTLAVFHKIYQELGAVSGATPAQIFVDIAVALSEELSTKWAAITDDQKKNLFDLGNYTEIFRRLPGFLTLVGQLVKPLYKPLPEQESAKRSTDRAALAIRRIIQHLDCHKAPYTVRFVGYVDRMSRGLTIQDFLEGIFERNVGLREWRPLVDTRSAVLAGRTIFIPMNDADSEETALELIASIRGDEVSSLKGIKIEPTHRTIRLPVPGYHAEAILGNCAPLENIPAPALTTVSATINTGTE